MLCQGVCSATPISLKSPAESDLRIFPIREGIPVTYLLFPLFTPPPPFLGKVTFSPCFFPLLSVCLLISPSLLPSLARINAACAYYRYILSYIVHTCAPGKYVRIHTRGARRRKMGNGSE